MHLSNNFSLEQLTFSETATRRGIANEPTPEQIINLTELANALDRVQFILGSPLHISSAFRSAKLNAAIGGSVTSAHMDGYAADFTCPQFGTPLEVCKAIYASSVSYDQLIAEGDWVHFSVRPTMRREVLTAHFHGGKALYTTGLA